MNSGILELGFWIEKLRNSDFGKEWLDHQQGSKQKKGAIKKEVKRPLLELKRIIHPSYNSERDAGYDEFYAGADDETARGDDACSS